jgi:teichuronic acid biosynthesis glycosyltransferase TuaC
VCNLRVLVLTDVWPTSHAPGEAPWAAIPGLLLQERHHEVAVAFLRRLFPPERLAQSIVYPRRFAREFDAWLQESLLAKPSYSQFVESCWYTSPPRGTSHHTWGDWAYLFAGRKLRRLASSFRPNVIHAHFAVPAGAAAQRLASHLDIPYVVSVHGADLEYTATLSARAADVVGTVLRSADAVIANSSLSAKRMERQWAVTNATILWQGGDSPVHTESVVSDPVRILTVGHLYENKGHREAATILSLAKTKGARFRWTIVGRGTIGDRQRLEAILESAGLTDVTSVIPHLSNSGVLHTMAESDVFLLLSKLEAYGVVYAEALGAGLAVVGSSTAGAVSDFCQAGAPLFSVEPRVTEETTQLITGILMDSSLLAQRKREAADWSRQHLGWGRYVDGLEGVYRGVVAARHGASDPSVTSHIGIPLG